MTPYYETELGKLYHGDCLEIMPELEPVDLVLTSPPYNMRTRIRNGEYTTREWSTHFSKKYEFFHDAYPINEYYKIHKSALIEMLKLAKTIFWNVQIVTGSKEAVFKLIGKFNKNIKDIAIWDKGFGQPSMHNNVLNRGYELIIILEQNASAGREFSKSTFKRGEMQDVWRINRGKPVRDHNACFSYGLTGTVLLNWESNYVLDPFLGSGTTAITCERFNRRWIGIEIEEKYCEIAAKRIEKERSQLKLFT